MKKMREPSEKLHKALYFLSGVMTVVLVFVLVAGVKTMAQNSNQTYEEAEVPKPNQQLKEELWQETQESTEQLLQEDTEKEPEEAASEVTSESQKVEKWQEGTISYQKKKH